ncbi:MAG: hypothetical protein OHK0057_31700 [Thermoflexibacter sp.]
MKINVPALQIYLKLVQVIIAGLKIGEIYEIISFLVGEYVEKYKSDSLKN